MIAGARRTVNVTALVVALPDGLVKTARYSLPFSAIFADAIVKRFVLAPATGQVVEYPIPSANSGYYNIALAGGDVWFAEAGAFGPVPTKVCVLSR